MLLSVGFLCNFKEKIALLIEVGILLIRLYLDLVNSTRCFGNIAEFRLARNLFQLLVEVSLMVIIFTNFV